MVILVWVDLLIALLSVELIVQPATEQAAAQWPIHVVLVWRVILAPQDLQMIIALLP
jgi:hypothetical protein